MQPTTNLNTFARRAGLLYLLLVPLGFYGLMYVQAFLLVANDVSATLVNIQANEMHYRLSIFAALLIQVIQLFIAIQLFQLFRSVDRMWALLIVLFTLVAMPIAMLNELSRIAILHLLNNGQATALWSPQQIPQVVDFLLKLNADGVMIAHIFWGLWLLPMGVLILKSRLLPSFIGWLMVLAFAGYIADTLLWMLVPTATYEVAVYTFWGEIIFPLWLVFKGVNTKLSEKIAGTRV